MDLHLIHFERLLDQSDEGRLREDTQKCWIETRWVRQDKDGILRGINRTASAFRSGQILLKNTLFSQFTLAGQSAPVKRFNGLSNFCKVIFIEQWLVDRKPAGPV